MVRERIGPGPARLAIAFAAGIAVATRAGSLAAAPAVWAAGALLVGLAIPARFGSVRLLLVVVFLGGARAALRPLPDPALLAGLPGVDDREPDRVTGVVRGAVLDGPDRRSFVVARAGAAAVLVTARAPLPALLPGDRVAVVGRLKSPRGYRDPGAVALGRVIDRRGASLTMAVDGSAVTVLGTGWSWRRWPTLVQRRLAGVVAGRGGDADGNAVVRAMVLGDRGGLTPDRVDVFRAAGVAHVLAVSGLHLAVITWLGFLVVRRLWGAVPALALRVDAQVAAALAAAPAALGYALVTGARVSTLRALLVVLVVLGGLACGRRARLLSALGLAALILLACDPGTLFDPGFQLSFAATATLVLAMGRRAAPRRADRWPVALARGLARRAGDLIRASLWATLATAPLCALWFGEVATGGVVANLIVVPLATLIILPLGLAGSLLHGLWPAAGGGLIDVAVAAAGWATDGAAAVGSRLPLVAVPPPTMFELGGALVAWIAAIAWARRRWRPVAVVAVAALGLGSWAGSWWISAELAPRARTELRVTFLDVGDGDAALLELPGGAVWLVDSGGLPFTPPGADPAVAATPGRRAVASFLAHRRIRRIDRVILSHPHPDHYAGLRGLLGRVELGEVWVAREHLERPPDPDYRALVVELMLRGVPVVHPRLDAPLVEHGVALEVLAPRYLDATAAIDPVLSANDNSLVVSVSYAGRRLLLLGDLEREGEELLLARYPGRLGATLVKVAHHGSKTSSSGPLVAATRPRWAVISCGVANRYGAPAASVVARWQDAGATVLRTDREGAITVSIGARGAISVATFERGGVARAAP